MKHSIRAVLVDPTVPKRLVIREVEAPVALWSEIAQVAQQLSDRQFPGKAVLHIQP